MLWMIATLAAAGAPGLPGHVEVPSAQPADAEGLPLGWRWAFEPIRLSEHWRSSGFTRLYEGGLLALDPGDDSTIIARHVYPATGPTRGAGKPAYEIVLYDDRGARLETGGWGMMANDALVSYRTTFHVDGGADRVASVGLAVLDLEGRRTRAEAAAKQAAATGARALPLPVIGEEYAFDLPTIDGKRIRSQDLRGKVVLIDCWATWCGPCMEKMPRLRAAEEALRDKGLVVIGINFDEDLGQARRAVEDQDLAWPQVHAASVAEGYDGDLWQDLTGIENLPRLFLIDRDGVLVDDFYPFDVEKTLRDAVIEAPEAP